MDPARVKYCYHMTHSHEFRSAPRAAPLTPAERSRRARSACAEGPTSSTAFLLVLISVHARVLGRRFLLKPFVALSDLVPQTRLFVHHNGRPPTPRRAILTSKDGGGSHRGSDLSLAFALIFFFVFVFFFFDCDAPAVCYRSHGMCIRDGGMCLRCTRSLRRLSFASFVRRFLSLRARIRAVSCVRAEAESQIGPAGLGSRSGSVLGPGTRYPTDRTRPDLPEGFRITGLTGGRRSASSSRRTASDPSALRNSSTSAYRLRRHRN